MFELPDKRAIFIIGFIAIVGIFYVLVPDSSTWSKPLNLMLSVSLIGGGIVSLVIELREGISITRPSVNRVDAPVAFLLEVVASLFCVYIGVARIISMP